jgi:hypothetical protein
LIAIGSLLNGAALFSGQPMLYLIDSKSPFVCDSPRHGHVCEGGAYFNKTRKGWFFGFKSHTLWRVDGRVINRPLAKARVIL